jgi:hypothetical protein
LATTRSIGASIESTKRYVVLNKYCKNKNLMFGIDLQLGVERSCFTGNICLPTGGKKNPVSIERPIVSQISGSEGP